MSNEVTLNGVEFTIWAEKEGAGYYGHWSCHECGSTGSSNHPDPTAERAITAVQIGASIHAERKHGKPDEQ